MMPCTVASDVLKQLAPRKGAEELSATTDTDTRGSCCLRSTEYDALTFVLEIVRFVCESSTKLSVDGRIDVSTTGEDDDILWLDVGSFIPDENIAEHVAEGMGSSFSVSVGNPESSFHLQNTFFMERTSLWLKVYFESGTVP